MKQKPTKTRTTTKQPKPVAQRTTPAPTVTVVTPPPPELPPPAPVARLTDKAKLAAVKARLAEAHRQALTIDVLTDAFFLTLADDVARIVDGPSPAPGAGDQSWRKSIDWVAAGRKAHETRMRNLAAANGGVAPAAAPSTRGPRPPQGDGSADAYITRVLTAMERTTPKGDNLRCASMVGRDFGGWIALGTDGNRALCRKKAAKEKAEALSKPVTEPGPAECWLKLTPEVEQAVREARRVWTKEHRLVILEVDARHKTLTVTARDLPAPLTVPIEGDLRKARIALDSKMLVEGFGRGGVFAWHYKPLTPIYLQTSDTLRYLLMPMREPVHQPTAPTTERRRLAAKQLADQAAAHRVGDPIDAALVEQLRAKAAAIDAAKGGK